MSEGKSERKEIKSEKDEHVVMMACCLGDRNNAIMTRLSGEDLTQIDALIEVEVFKSRSEAAAFFIKEGMQARKDLFRKIMPSVEKIRELKALAKKPLANEEQ